MRRPSRKRAARAQAVASGAGRSHARRPPDDGPPTIPIEGGARARWGWIAVVLAWALLFAPQIFAHQELVLGDTRVYRPFPEFSRERWLTVHQRTHWNPYVYAGIPSDASLADPRPQYLPDVLLDGFERVRPSNVVPIGGPLLAYLIGMLAMAALARRLWGAGPVGMAFAGIAWGLAPQLFVPLAYGHHAEVVSYSLLPPLLWILDRLFTTDAANVPATSLLLAGVAGVMVLTGHPQVLVYAAMFAGAFAIQRAWHFRRRRRLAWCAGGVALAVLLSAAVWLPVLLYSAGSFRGGAGTPGIPRDEILRFSLAWRDLLTMAWPWAVGFGGRTYWGGLAGNDYPRFLDGAVVLMAAAALLGGGGRERGLRRFLLAAVLFALLSTLGPNLGVIGDALRGLVPMSSRFRVSVVWMGVVELAVVLLASRAFVRPLRVTIRPRVGWIVSGVLLLFGLALAGPLAGAYAGWVLDRRPALDPELALSIARAAGWDLAARALALSVAIGLIGLMHSESRRAGIAAAAVVLLTTLGLGSALWPVLRRSSGPPSRIAAAPMPELARVGARAPWARVSSTRWVPSNPADTIRVKRDIEFYSNDWIRWRAHSLGGDHGALPAIWRPMAAVTRSFGALRALGVVYMSADSNAHWSAERFEEIHRDPREVVYRLRGALGRAYAVTRVEHRVTDGEVLAAMTSAGFDPSRVAYTTFDGDAGDYPGSATCRISWITDEPDHVVLECDAPGRVFLVLADTWFTGWSARLDGKTAMPIARVDQLARGVALPAGRHRVEMTFEPAGWRTGVRLTRSAFLALLLGAAAITVAGLRRRSTRRRRDAVTVPSAG
ncbi:MAG TPA: hypothetical protein VL123_00880 [Candidatus Udaeobacter sp.]|jgi:hypothetical protein|nr:hypothetical protein [Candidatus Udaeobacter sp.]